MPRWRKGHSDTVRHQFSVGPLRIEFKNHTSRWSADAYHYLLDTTWPRLMLFFFAVYMVVNATFGFLYWVSGNGIQNARPGSYTDAFFFSVQTYATIGYGSMSPQSNYAHVLVCFEAFCGMMSTALGTGILFAKFSRPRPRITFSEKMVVHVHNGEPVLQFRLANQRRGTLSNAVMTLSVVADEVSAEGLTLRRIHALPLDEPNAPLLFLAWSAVHVLNERSPLFRISPDNVGERIIGALAGVTAMDDTTRETVHVRQFYRPEDIVFDARFVRMVDHRDARGVATMDCARLSDVEPADVSIREAEANGPHGRPANA